MKYQELDRAGKMSFTKTVNNYITDSLRQTNYEIATRDFVDVEFIKGLMRYLKELQSEQYAFQKWIQAGLVIEENELLSIVTKMVSNMRKKKPTEKQVQFYEDMVKALNVDSTVPEDFLVYQMKLAKLKQMSQSVRKATKKQIKAVKKQWLRVFDEEIELDENTTHEEIQELFAKISSGVEGEKLPVGHRAKIIKF